VIALVLGVCSAVAAYAHIFIFQSERIGAAPCTPGGGWSVECFYPVPVDNASSLLIAELWANGQTPAFTFHADFLDWPSGPAASRNDADLATLGDLLDNYITDLSDPAALALPIDSFLLRARGVINIQTVDNELPIANPQTWISFGLSTFDGGRVRISNTTIFRTNTPTPLPFRWDNAIFQLPGAYPIEVTLFNRHDPENLVGMPNAGFELYTCHEGGLILPGADAIPCFNGAAAGGTPPRVIYDATEVGSIVAGDLDVDNDVDLADFAGLQRCFTGENNEGFLSVECQQFDLDADNDIDVFNWNAIAPNFIAPGVCLSAP